MNLLAIQLITGLGLAPVFAQGPAVPAASPAERRDTVLISVPATVTDNLAGVAVVAGGEVWWMDRAGNARSWSPHSGGRAWSLAHEIGNGRVLGLAAVATGGLAVLVDGPLRVLIVTVAGAKLSEVTLPETMRPSGALSTDPGVLHTDSDWIYVAGYNSAEPGGQVHRFSIRALDRPRVLGLPRSTQRKEVFPYLQGGTIIGQSDGTLLHAWINPLRIDQIDPESGRVHTLIESDYLPDGEDQVIQILDDGRAVLTNGYTRVTGLVRDPQRRVWVSAYLPHERLSRLLLFDRDARLIGDRMLPGMISIRGQLSDGRIVALRAMGMQEVVVLTAAQP